MTEISPSLSLPFLAPAQAQKHVTVNEALARLDIVVQLVVEAFDAVTPPGVPVAGMVYALGVGASDAWAGQDGRLAAYADGAWVFVAPRAGWIATQGDSGALRVYRDGSWQTPELAHDSLDGVGIHASADATNRLVVRAPASLFTGDDGGHQVKINKDAASDTASLLFQSAYSGRAEMGLAGSNDFSIKVSPDGSAFSEALLVDGTTGFIGLGTPPTRRLSISGDMLAISTGGGAGVIANRTDGIVTSLQAGLTTARFLFDDTGDFAVSNNTRSNIEQATSGGAGTDFIVAQSASGNLLLATESGGKVGIGPGAATPQAKLDVDGAIRPATYSVASLPDASAEGAGALIYVDDASGGGVIVFSDGTAWRRCTDRSVVS